MAKFFLLVFETQSLNITKFALVARGGSRISRGGGGVNLLFDIIFAKNCMEIEGARAPT